MARAKLHGAEAMKKRLQTFAKKFPDEVGRALYLETEIDAKEVKRRTPVRHGTLRGSVHVQGPDRRWRTISTLIVAGGPAAPYAVYVHENLEALHKVGQAKFLESVILESRPYITQRVAKRIELKRALPK